MGRPRDLVSADVMAYGRVMEPEELAAAIKALTAWAERNAPVPEPLLRRRLREHLAVEPTTLEVLSEDLSRYDHVNVQVALDALSADDGTDVETIGLSLERGFRASLAEIAQETGMYGSFEPGPVEYASIDVGDRVISCIQAGLLLVAEGDERLAVTLSPDEDAGLRLEAMATRRMFAEAWLERLHALMDEHNVYRGKVVAFGGNHPFHEAPLTVRRLPEVSRERIVLPEGTLDRIERHTVGFARHREALRAAGQHIKRGILLHGPPGTGKTLTIMHLAGLMPERTVILLTGSALGAIGPACRLARSLEPAMVVLEDVDLVALERGHYLGNSLLFELLNEMDGLDEDADLIFALTTNRPETLEPALASRPGRIDLAVELPLPDAAARRRLLDLYSEGLEVTVTDWDPIVERLEATSPAFIRELLRQSTLAAVEAGRPAGRVGEEDLLATVDQLKSQSGRLTATLLGAERPLAGREVDEEVDDDLDEEDVVWED